MLHTDCQQRLGLLQIPYYFVTLHQVQYDLVDRFYDVTILLVVREERDKDIEDGLTLAKTLGLADHFKVEYQESDDGGRG